MKKTKVLYYNPVFTKYGFELSKNIASDDFDVSYLTSKTTDYWKFEEKILKNFKSLQIPSLAIPIKTGIRGKYFEFFSIGLISFILRIKPDIIIIDTNPFFSFIYLFLGKIMRSKIIGFTTNFPDTLSLWGKISNFVLKNNDPFTNQYCVANSIKKQLMVDMGINSEKINVIGHGVDTTRFIIDNKKIKQKFPNNKKIILFVGRFVYYKGIEYLIESFALVNKKIKNSYLVLIGDGPEKQKIKQMINQHDLENDVLLIENVPNSEISKYYLDADVIVVPSIEPEPFGLIFIEGMASGKPIVTFDVNGGEKDLIINGKNGYRVEVKNISKFSSKIIELLSNPQIQMDMGSYARQFVEEKFDIRVIASCWRTMIRDVMNSKNK